MNYSRGPQLIPKLLEHLKIFIVFKCPNSNTIRFNSKIQDGLEIGASFLAEVLDQFKNDGHLLRAFWVH